MAGGTELQEKGKREMVSKKSKVAEGRGHPGEPKTGVAAWGSHLHEMGCAQGFQGSHDVI